MGGVEGLADTEGVVVRLGTITEGRGGWIAEGLTDTEGVVEGLGTITEGRGGPDGCLFLEGSGWTS